MTMRLICLLIATCTLLVAGCQPGDNSAGVGEAAVTPVENEVAPTTLPDATHETSVPATGTPVPGTSTPVPTPGPGDGATDADAADAQAADAAVLFVHAAEESDGSWTFRVTVAHPDTGWEDYADGWDVVTPDGTVLKPNPDDAFTRVLLHPHENEQPFTRSQRDIVIPEGVTTVTVRAHDLVDGFGGREVQVDLEADSGPDFEVERQP